MYQIVGVWKLVTVFATLAVALALLSHFLLPVEDIVDALRRSTGTVTLTGALALVIGQTPLFPVLCRLPLLRNVFPPIDGKWTGTFSTNCPQIAKAFKLDAPNAAESVVAEFSIEVRLLTVRIRSVSVLPRPDYMRSHTTAFSIFRCPQTGREILHYVYDAFVGQPTESDVASFHGAAKLVVIRDSNEIWLEGNYWTDRNWPKGYNTAGSLKLVRDGSVEA
jgi:hypothetical protein